MRLCILTTSYPRFPGDDAGIFVQRLVNALAAAGSAGCIIAPACKDEPAIEQNATFTVHRYKYGIFRRGKLAFGCGILPNIRANPLLVFQIPLLLVMMLHKSLALRRSYEVLQANWISSGVVAWLVHQIAGKPYVITLRGEDFKILRIPVLKFLFSSVLRKAQCIVTVNHEFLEKTQGLFGIPRGKLRCIPNGVEMSSPSQAEIERFAAENQLDLNAKYLLFVGRLIPLKRAEKLIELLRAPLMENYRLILCGGAEDGYLRNLRKLCVAGNCTARVIFAGHISPTEIPCYLAISRFFISASTYEGRPNSVMEALAAGKTVFLSDIAGHRELVQNEVNGFLFDPSDVNGLARKLNEVDRDFDLRARIAKNAAAFAAQFSWENCARNYLLSCRSVDS